MKAAAGWRDHVHGYGFEVLLKPTLTLKADAKLRSAHKIHNPRVARHNRYELRLRTWTVKEFSGVARDCFNDISSLSKTEAGGLN